ncbi:4'-phosphopantetheinyl transferase family protein [Thiomonas bhubaneswarensis]|nr:4'-phosphopantetheinyl transferase superfamily protein [Thiomonas bhubaneswarensis]
MKTLSPPLSQQLRQAMRPGGTPRPREAAAPLARPQLRDVHIWELDLRHPPAHAFDLLDSGEQERARRFVFAIDQTRYIAAHGWMRQILGRYLGRAPQDLTFIFGPHGKPALIGRRDDVSLCFNLSHSLDKALLAVSNGMPVGVDIEAIRPDLPDSALAAGVLTEGELDELAQLPPRQQTAVFFSCWTRKEACMKALGLGLALEPKTLHVGMMPARQRVIADEADDFIDVSPLPSPSGHAAALATLGGFGKVLYRQATASGRPD